MSELFGSSEFWSALAGAVVGGAIALVGQIYAVWATKRQNDDSRALDEAAKAADVLEAKRMLAQMLLIKMMRIVSSLKMLADHIKEAIPDFPTAPAGLTYAQVLRPLATLPDPVIFAPEQLAMLKSLNIDDVFHATLGLDESHNHDVALFRRYEDLRRSAQSGFGAEMDGMWGTTSLTEKQAAWLAPRFAEMNDFIAQMAPMIAKDAAEARATLEALHAGLVDKLGLTSKLVFID